MKQTARDIIMGSAGLAGYHSISELAYDLGIHRTTLGMKLAHPECFTGYELGAIMRMTAMEDKNRLALLEILERG